MPKEMSIIFALSKDQFQCVKGLLPRNEGYVEPKAVLETNNPGWVFADSICNPQAALIWSQGNEGFYLAGRQIARYSGEINALIDTVIRPMLLSKGIDYFEVSSVPPVTDSELQDAFPSRKLNSWQQSVYIYRKNQLVPDIVPREGCLCNMKDIWYKHSVQNLEFVENKILDYWDSINVFHAKANGFCLIMNDMVVSLSLTGWIFENTHEISIETVKDYRRKGFAKIVSAALVNAYLEQGCLPYWECEKSNTASAKLAVDLGFTKFHDYTCFGFPVSK